MDERLRRKKKKRRRKKKKKWRISWREFWHFPNQDSE
jgi:hypothetical protein